MRLGEAQGQREEDARVAARRLFNPFGQGGGVFRAPLVRVGVDEREQESEVGCRAEAAAASGGRVGDSGGAFEQGDGAAVVAARGVERAEVEDGLRVRGREVNGRLGGEGVSGRFGSAAGSRVPKASAARRHPVALPR